MRLLNEKIRRLRKERGWTQNQLADRVNVSTQVISNWERGYTKLNQEDIMSLSKAFNIEANELFDTKENIDNKKLKFANEIFNRFDFDPDDDDIKELIFDAIEFANKQHKKKNQ